MNNLPALRRRIASGSALFLCLSSVGCSNLYYGAMETFLGKDKRHILASRVETARETQTEAKQEFKSALEQFSALIEFSGGELEEKYKKLESVYRSSERKANAVSERIRQVEKVGSDLFAEWRSDIEGMSSESLKAKDEQLLEATEERYQGLLGAMKRAEGKMDPVLTSLKDHVLFLKHNLNAKAIAALGDELKGIESNVASLVAEMEAAISEADAFIAEMESQAS